jgi:hypothetical protein
MDAADYSTVIARLGSDHCDAVMNGQPVLTPDPTVLDDFDDYEAIEHMPTMEDLLADIQNNEQAQQSSQRQNPIKASSLGCNVPTLINIAALQQTQPPLPSLPAQGANMGAPSSTQAAAPAGLPMPASLDRLLPSGELPRPGSGADSPAAPLGITIQQLRQQQAASSQLPGLQQRQQQQQGRQATPTEAGQYSGSQGSTDKLLQLQRAHRELQLQLNLATRHLEEQGQARQAMQQLYTAQIPAARRQQGTVALPAVPGSPAHMSLHDGSTAAAGAGQQQQQALPSSSVPLPASMQLVGLTGPNLSSTDMQASWQLPLGRLPMPSDLILHQHRNLDLSGHNLANGMAMGNLGSLGMGLPSGPDTMRQLPQLLGEGLPLDTCAMADDPCIIAELLRPAPKLPTASAAADINELLRAAFAAELAAPGSMPAAAPALRQQQQQQQQGSTLLGPAPITAAALAQLGQPSPGEVPALASEQRLSTMSIGALQYSDLLGLLQAGLRGAGSGRCCAAGCALLAVRCWLCTAGWLG